jgi:hypothetical protein
MANVRRLIDQASGLLGGRNTTSGQRSTTGRRCAPSQRRGRSTGGRGSLGNGLVGAVQGFLRGSGRR